MRYGVAKGSFQLDDMPGCSQIGISHSLFIYPSMRGKGFSAGFMEMRIAYAIAQGYDMLLATVDDNNTPQVVSMRKAGWKQLETFVSSKTQHSVSLWCLRLNPNPVQSTET